MRRQITVGRAKRAKSISQQYEMLGLFGGDARPVRGELARQLPRLLLSDETGDNVPAEIDRVQFDMRQCMKERNVAGARSEMAAFRQVARRDQDRAVRARRTQWRHSSAYGQTTVAPACSKHPAQRDLLSWIGGFENRRRAAA